MFNESHNSNSPDGNHSAQLTFAGEIRFGPCYFSLRLDDRELDERLFGRGILWSPDSSIVCLQEWHTTNYNDGPITSLMLVRPGNWTFYSFPVLNGFASPNTFVDDSLVLCHSERQTHSTVDLETDLAEIDDWLPLQF